MARGAWSTALAAAVLGCLIAAATPVRAQSESSTFTLWPKWAPFLDLGGMVGTKRNIGEATLFVPVWQNESAMLFGDVRFKADDQNSHEGNFGLGFRHMLANGWNAGLYGFYDRRRSPYANFFNQFTVGAELLGTNFDFRFNTYWPFGNVQQTVGAPTTGQTTASVSGASLMVNTPATMQTYEYALRGFDGEAGVRVPITPAQSPYKLRFYVGGYRFDEPSGVVPVVAGPRLRLEFTDYEVKELWGGTRFTISTEWQTDQVRGSQFFAGFRLRVPLQAEARRSTFTMQERRMTDAIIRDVDIVSNTQSIQIAPAITEAATATAGGQAITAINSSTTSGTQLQTALNTAGANSTVVMSGSFNTAGAITTLQAGQTVMGSGTLALRTASGRTVTATVVGNASITGNVGGANYTVVMANNSTLSGMTINNTDNTGNNAQGIRVNGVTGVTISNNTINATQTASGGTAHGIDVVGGGSATITGNTITALGPANGANSIAVQVNGSTATVSGNSLSASGATTTANNQAARLVNATILGGSTGNVSVSGTCSTSGVNTGSVTFTNGTTCP